LSIQDDPIAITHALKDQARRLGFDLVGVTTPDPPPHFDVYESWLVAGRHGQMAYLATERARLRRSDPRRILPECKSILMVGANCRADKGRVEDDRERIAAYAQGEDYHTVLTERLEALMGTIRDLTGLTDLPYRIYTDTGPLMERELAQRAGLGWIGKNTCLINPERGSYFLLAEILLGVRLAPDQPFPADRCGSCTRCIDACPTDCILPDRTLDANRCISYLTIEVKGTIPTDLRASVGNWVFGCDVCQEVCPWNVRFSRPTIDPAFQPNPGWSNMKVQDLLELRAEDWKRRLDRSPLARPKRRGLVRNAAIVAGNLKKQEHIRPLARVFLDDPDPIPRSHAAWALGKISGPVAHETLRSARSKEKDPQVLGEIDAALRSIEGE
jgi:epoxyqueuosine reductase